MTKKIDESTVAANIPDVPAKPTGTMHNGCPYFNCDHNPDMFWKLHTKARGKGKWFKNHYQDEPVANWARQNKGKNFYLQHDSMFRKVKAK